MLNEVQQTDVTPKSPDEMKEKWSQNESELRYQINHLDEELPTQNVIN